MRTKEAIDAMEIANDYRYKSDNKNIFKNVVILNVHFLFTNKL